MGELLLNPSEKIFYDGILTIICDDNYDVKRTGSVEFKIICGEFDSPMSLEEIYLEHPDVIMVIYEEPLKGYVFRFGNHKFDGKRVWEKTGETMGYA